MRRSTLVALSVVGVASLAVAGWAWFGLRGNASTHVVAVNVPLPELRGETLSGAPFDSSSLRGHVSVINIWATWCVPCEQELPDLVNTARHYGPEGVKFLGVNERDDRALAKGWQDQRFAIPYPTLFDPSGRFAGSLKFPSVPDTYVVDASGTVRWVIYGRTDQQELSGLVDQVLASDAATA